MRMFIFYHLQSNILGPMSQLVIVHEYLKILTSFLSAFEVDFHSKCQLGITRLLESLPIRHDAVQFPSGSRWPLPGSLFIFPLLSCNGCCSFKLSVLMHRVHVSLRLDPDAPFRESTVSEIWILKSINCHNCLKY